MKVTYKGRKHRTDAVGEYDPESGEPGFDQENRTADLSGTSQMDELHDDGGI